MKKWIISYLSTQWPNLIDQATQLHFRRGQILFYEDHQPYGLLVVFSGKIKLDCNKKRMRTEEIYQMPQGLLIGIPPLLEISAYCCTGIALTDCEVIFISKTSLAPFLDKVKHLSSSKTIERLVPFRVNRRTMEFHGRP